MQTLSDIANDLGDRDPGDYDVTEVLPVIVDRWHPSFVMVQPAALTPATQTGREYLAQLLENQHSRAKPAKPARMAYVSNSCWKDTPDPFKRLVARSAGLGPDVVEKADRDLTEQEKGALRAAAARLLKLATTVFAL